MVIGLLLITSSALLTVADGPRARFNTPLAESELARSARASRSSQQPIETRVSPLESRSNPEYLTKQGIIPPIHSPTESANEPETSLLPPGRTTQTPQIPAELRIPAIDLAAPVYLSDIRTVKIAGKEFQDWLVPDEFAAGWQSGSARLGEKGNIVLNGHHNVFGGVFASLVDLQPGDEVLVFSEDTVYPYKVTNKMILPEKYEDIDVRASNALWLMPSEDERLTLVTCWPAYTNTHRLILVARPDEEIDPYPFDLQRLPQNKKQLTQQ